MSELTKRLEGSVCYASTNKEWPNVLLQEAADRIEALEEGLRYYMSQFGQALDAHGIPYGDEQDRADKQARALLEGK